MLRDRQIREAHPLSRIRQALAGVESNDYGYGGLFLDHARFDPVLSAAESVDLPIYIHPGLPEAPIVEAYYTGNWAASVRFMFCGNAFGWRAEAGIHVLRLIRSTSSKPPAPQAFTRVLTAELMLVNATAEAARIHARAVKSG